MRRNLAVGAGFALLPLFFTAQCAPPLDRSAELQRRYGYSSVGDVSCALLGGVPGWHGTNGARACDFSGRMTAVTDYERGTVEIVFVFDNPSDLLPDNERHMWAALHAGNRWVNVEQGLSRMVL